MRTASRSLTTLAFIALSGSMGGCSFLVGQAPPPHHESLDHFDCSGYAPPVADTIWVALNAVGAVVAARTDQAAWDRSGQLAPRELTIAGSLLWVAFSGASSIYGYKIAADCSAAQEALVRRGSVPEGPLILR